MEAFQTCMTLRGRKQKISYFPLQAGERSSTQDLNCLERIINSSAPSLASAQQEFVPALWLAIASERANVFK